MPSAVPRPDRRTGRATARSSSLCCRRSGSVCLSGRPRTRPGAVAADKAYSSRANRSYLRKRSIKAVIPEKKDQAANRKKKGSRGGRPTATTPISTRSGTPSSGCINKLKAWRGIATRYDKTPESYLAGLHLRASMIWINDLLATD